MTRIASVKISVPPCSCKNLLSHPLSFLPSSFKKNNLGLSCPSEGCGKGACNCYTGQCDQCEPGYYGPYCLC